ncbi:MAG: ribonuclease H-like domain-containing protein [Desulfarculaceae bacterium]|jgi:hypothetical protein
MLKRTFIHIPGVGAKRELGIWKTGIQTWEDFLEHGRALLPPRIFGLGLPVIRRSLAAWQSPGGTAELAAMIPWAEHWRFWPEYGRVVYLDIESGGDPQEWGGITMVGLYDGQAVEQYVSGHNIWLINDAMKQYDVVCTFAGRSFDIPVLKQVFPNLIIPPVHIDLRWVLKRLGLGGGLKRIEKMLGLGRPTQVQDLDGYGAVRLWAAYQQGDAKALDTLLAYNACDVVNLKPLLEYGVSELRRRLLGRLGGLD